MSLHPKAEEQRQMMAFGVGEASFLLRVWFPVGQPRSNRCPHMLYTGSTNLAWWVFWLVLCQLNTSYYYLRRNLN